MRLSRLPYVACAVSSFAAACAFAAGPSLTVYARDLGLVRESRTLDLAGATDTVRIADIPERIDIASVRLVPEAGRVGRLAYRYDVASGDALFEHARGARVRVAMRENHVVEGTLVTADGSWLVVREDDGSLHNLSRTSIDDVRLPETRRGVATRPSLEAVIDGARKGRVPAELSYLTGGLSWNAEHTIVRTGEKTATWASEVTVENVTGRDFSNATLRLVAGDPRRVGGVPHQPMMMRAMAAGMDAMEKSAELVEETFSEYHLYSLGRPATLRDRETQKLTMLDARKISVAPRYLFRGMEGNAIHAQVELRNTKAEGPGAPLPSGRVRFYEADASGALHFTGETRIGHTAEGEKATLDIGNAFDLAGERRETSQRRLSDREREFSVEIELRNRKKTPVLIVVEEMVGGEIEVTQQSLPSVRKDSSTLRWEVAVPAGREVMLSYTARQRF